MNSSIFQSPNRISRTALALTCLLLLAGCATSDTGSKSTLAGAKPGVGGAKLWAQNCGHCHNIRSPNSLSDAQWEVASMHMRLRANLTASEYREVLAFLKSAH